MQHKRLKTFYLLVSVLSHNQVLLLSMLIFKDLKGYKLSNPLYKMKGHLNMLSKNSNTLMYTLFKEISQPPFHTGNASPHILLCFMSQLMNIQRQRPQRGDASFQAGES